MQLAHHHRTAGLALLGAVVGALVTGCALQANSGALERNPNCAVGYCPSANRDNVGVEIFATALGAQEFPSIPYDSLTGTFQLETSPLVRLSGAVKLPIELAGLDLKSGVVVATRPSRLVGRPEVSYQGTLNPTTGKYQIDLPPNLDGEVYTLRVAVDDQLLPPFSIDVELVRDTSLDLVPAAPTPSLAIGGKVLSALGAPLVGIEVIGRDPETNKLVSTRAHTDATGHFELYLGSQSGSGGLRLTAQINETLRLERIISSMPTSNGPSEVVLQLPALPNPVPQSFRLAGLSSSGIEQPVIGARAKASARILDKASDVVAIHELQADSDSEGRVTLNLYPAESAERTYQLDVATLGNSDFRSTTVSIAAGPVAGYSSTIMLEPRPAVFGVVLDAVGRPLSGATITPRTTTFARNDAAESLQALLQPSTTSDADGKFTMRLDPGAYDLEIVPPVSSQLPRRWLVQQMIEAQTDLGLVSLPASLPLVGRIVDLQQKPLANVTVRFFALPTESAYCATSDLVCQRPARLQAELTSRQDGTVEALLPP